MSDILDIIRGKSDTLTAEQLVGKQGPRQQVGVPMTAEELVGKQGPREEVGTPLTAGELVGTDTSLDDMELAQMQELQRTAAEQRQSVVFRVNKAIGDFARSAIQGGTLGLSDEIAGVISQVAGNRDFNEAISLERAKLAMADPATRFLGELTGSVLTGVATGGLVSPATQGLARVAKFAAIGATEGAIAGFGHAEGDVLARGTGAAQGAAVGGVVGAAAPVLVEKFVAGARTLMGHPKTTAAQKAAVAKLAKAMARDEITPDRALAKLKQLGPHATIADLPGANVQGVARAAAGTPGPARQLADRTLTTRAVTAPTRVSDAVTAATSDESMLATRNALIASRAAAARPLYEQAFAVGQVDSPAVKNLLEKSADVKAALKQARRIPEYADLADNSVIMLDKAYKNIGGKYSAAIRAGDKELARDLNGVRLTLRNAMPESYRKALDAFSSESDLIDALEVGRKFIKEDTEVLADTVKAMSAGEKEQFVIGVSRAIRERLDAASDSVGTARRIFGNAAIREKLKIAMPGQFREFQKTMLQEATFSRTAQKMLGGSPTAPRAAEMSDLATQAAFASRGSPSGMLFALADMLRSNKIPSRELGQAMFTASPVANRGVFDQMQELAFQRQITRPFAGGLTGAAVTGGSQVGR